MYITRERLEEIEAQTLASYALLSKNSRGRQHHEHEPKYRTAFQRDRDRVIHSAAFRRLEYKTQVFVNDAGDYYRTRLTHTLEVAQIGRTLARGLSVNEDLVEVICLAHDLGHPPFGHAGEHVLDQLMQEHGGFNHNHQSYRVVTELEQRYPQWNGLNLTYETLEGIAKHETEYDISNTAGFDENTRGSVEAQIADVADELAYNAHDLDDGIQSGLIQPHQLEKLEIWRELCDRLEWRGGPMDEITRHRFIREQIGMQVDDVLTQTMQNLQAINAKTAADIQQQPVNIVTHSDRLKKLNRALKNFLYENMYYHYTVVRMAKRAERIISELFQSYVSEPKQLPPEQRQRLESEPLERVVADYIASMTDRSAFQSYRRLFDPLTRP
ncbi:MAG: deoxyguanosinetriphosphate triphosphohydrolase [Phototrophicales bacterium]|nr:MAG: deoxyguanosinetriphosphate triphosphohydrolase [Phototrophicales bacterium]RMG72531.1 MAG: deoxyguanosinetriphosphate triphosphohydrolase [Chloroflexota bacterium]